MSRLAVRGVPALRGAAAYVVLVVLLALVLGRLLTTELETQSATRLAVAPLACLFALVAGWLALERPLAAFVLAFALLGIVRVEPAPVDAVFALLIVASFATRAPRPQVPIFVAMPLAGLLLMNLLSTVNAINLHRAVKFGATTTYMIVLAVWLSWVFMDRVWVHVGYRTYVIVAAICGALGPVILFAPGVPHRDFFIYGGARAKVLFKDPNVYSAFLVPAGIFLLEELSTPRLLQWRKSVLVGAFACVCLGVVVAYSRAGWLDFVLAVAVLLTVQACRRRGIQVAAKTILVVAIGAIAGFLLLLQTGSIRFLEERSHLQAYDSTRFSTQSSAFSDMTRHLLGYGPGQTEYQLPISTHSSFARAAFEQGLVGITLLCLVFGGTLFCALILARRQWDFHGVGTAGLLGIWIGQVANSFFIDTLHWRHLWIMAGLIWCGYSMTSKVDHESTSTLQAAGTPAA